MNKKPSDKDLKDWNKFVKSKDKIISKDELNEPSINKNKSTFVIDLHGYGLDQANKFVEKTINECFEKHILKVNIITGKGMRSKSAEDPYKSSELSILKHSIPEFINSNVELMKKIKNIDNTKEKNLGSFNVYLRSKNKFR
ncbi:Smr/MutS family protein [Candidatus Pelagibacter communis]|uniref:Smr/MutS family protein n=1 Tax=Pelagibacter ubique TaxID=198252 RepID=UPI00094CB6E0|nr:Smr/MutS family protein [Candidatus Pelagibacter ubique]